MTNIEHFIERSPSPERRSPEQERYEDERGDTQALLRDIQNTTRQYDPDYLETAAKIIEKSVLEDNQTTPSDGFSGVKVKHAIRVALGLSPLPAIHQEEGEQ